MKRNIITFVGAVVIIGGIVAFNVRFNEKMDPAAAKAEAKADKKADEKASDETPGAESSMKSFEVKFETTKGDFVVAVDPDLAPLGAAQFKEIVTSGAYKDARFFRVVPGFVVQWGIPGDPKLAALWDKKTIKDEPVKASNVKGTITYAKSGLPNSRSSQVFINLGNNSNLDGMGFSPFGKVVEGMDVIESITSEYGESPDQFRIESEGNAYLEKSFPNLDYIKSATVIEDEEAHQGHDH